MKLEILTGRKFNRLTVLSYYGVKRPYKHQWLCLCDCGNEKVVVSHHLKSGAISSCGCNRYELSRLRLGTHGMSKTKEHKTWRNIKERCLNPNKKAYKDYGGRGITVCDEWVKSFETFFADMGFAPTDKHTIERLDNHLGYTKSNCVWLLNIYQNQNKRSVLGVEKVCEIKRDIQAGLRSVEISRKYKTTEQTISNIKLGKTYRNVTIPEIHNISL